MTVTLIAVGLIAIVLIIKMQNLNRQLAQDVEKLFHSSTACKRVFHDEILVDLPAPVQRYFRRVLKNGQPYISQVRLKHNGYFKTNKDSNWVKIQGEEYFTTCKPGLVWIGKTNTYTARDILISGKGRLEVRLFSLFRIANRTGYKINQGEVLRWLGESVWFPTNLLPSDSLHWESINENTAKMIFTYNGLSVFYIVKFNKTGEIIQLETKRFMGEKSEESWIGKISNYKEWDAITLPMNIEAIWRLKSGDFCYAKFNLTELDYDLPKSF